MPDNPSTNPFTKRIVWCSLAATAVLLFLSFTAWRHSAASRVAAELKRIQQAGEPTSWNEFAGTVSGLREDEDTTQLWLAGLNAMHTRAFRAKATKLPFIDSSDWPEPGAPADELPQFEEMRQLVMDYDFVLDQFHAASLRGGRAAFSPRYDPHETRYSFALLSELPDLQDCSKFLLLEAYVHGRRNDASCATASVDANFRLMKSLDSSPTVIAGIMRGHMQHRAIYAIEDLLPLVTFSDVDLQRWQAELRAVDFQRDLRDAWVWERAAAVDAFRDVKFRTLLNSKSPTVGNNEELLALLEVYGEFINASRSPWPVFLQQVETAKQRCEQRFREPAAQWRYLMLSCLLPPTPPATIAAQATARSQVADAGLAVELFRRQKHRLPTTLDELAPTYLPGVPVDPFDGQPIQCDVSDGEFVVCNRARTKQYGSGFSRTEQEKFRLRSRP